MNLQLKLTSKILRFYVRASMEGWTMQAWYKPKLSCNKQELKGKLVTILSYDIAMCTDSSKTTNSKCEN